MCELVSTLELNIALKNSALHRSTLVILDIADNVVVEVRIQPCLYHW